MKKRGEVGPGDDDLGAVNGEDIIPYDAKAFWKRLCDLIRDRFAECESEEECVSWLAKAVNPDTRRKFKRWGQGKRPRWKSLIDVCTALNTKGPDRPRLSLRDLVEGLPPSTSKAPDADDDDQAEVDFCARIEDILRRASGLASALAKKPSLRGSANTGEGTEIARRLATALMRAPAKQVAMDVASVVAELPRERQAARELLWSLLPIVGDWDAILNEAEGGSSAEGSLELKLRTETVAEIVMARVDARCCMFAPGHSKPQGVGHVPFPAATYSPMFDQDGDALVAAILINLRKRRAADEPKLPCDGWVREIERDFPDEESFGIVVQAEIEASRSLKKTRYMLFIDEDLKRIGDVEHAWKVTQKALRAGLPGLRLVRLKGGTRELRSEYGLVPYIGEVNS